MFGVAGMAETGCSAFVDVVPLLRPLGQYCHTGQLSGNLLRVSVRWEGSWLPMDLHNVYSSRDGYSNGPGSTMQTLRFAL